MYSSQVEVRQCRHLISAATSGEGHAQDPWQKRLEGLGHLISISRAPWGPLRQPEAVKSSSQTVYCGGIMHVGWSKGQNTPFLCAAWMQDIVLRNCADQKGTEGCRRLVSVASY